MTDFRALCAELLFVFDNYDEESSLGGIIDDMKANKNDLFARARAALAQPEGQGPSETAWALAQLLDGVQRHDLPNMTGLSDLDCDRIWAARWGRPTAQPIPVSERYEFSVYDEEDREQAGGDASTLEDAMREGSHYLAQYQQNGPHRLELRRASVLPLPQSE